MKPQVKTMAMTAEVFTIDPPNADDRPRVGAGCVSYPSFDVPLGKTSPGRGA